MKNKKTNIWKIAICLGAIATCFATGASYAQSSRIYIAGYLGLNMHSESPFSETTSGLSGDYELDNTQTFAGALGLRIDKNWRVEGEVSYRKADFNRVDFSSGGTSSAGGDIGTWLYMANVYYDFDYKWRNMQPFVSAGIGLASHSFNYEDTSSLLPSRGADTFDLAWQVGAGMKYRFNDSVALTSNYRYLATSELNVSSFNADYNSHEFRVGVEYDIPVQTFNNILR